MILFHLIDSQTTEEEITNALKRICLFRGKIPTGVLETHIATLKGRRAAMKNGAMIKKHSFFLITAH